MKSILAILAFAALVWWLSRQVAIHRSETLTRLDRLRQLTKKAA